jgi:lipoprotein signal peptidase
LVVEHPTAYAQAVLRPRSYVDVPRHGVVDFIVVYYRPGHRWPAFNLADTWLVLGIGLLLLYLARNGAFTKHDHSQA